MPALSAMPRLLPGSVLRAGRFGLLCLFLSTVVACATATGSGQVPDSSDAERVEGEYLVELAGRESARAILEQAFRDHGLERIEALETNRPLYLIRLTPDPGPDAVREWTAADKAIRRAEPNYRYSGSDGDTGWSNDSGQ